MSGHSLYSALCPYLSRLLLCKTSIPGLIPLTLVLDYMETLYRVKNKKKIQGAWLCILELWEVLVLHSEYIILIFWRKKVIFLFYGLDGPMYSLTSPLRWLGVLSYKSMILGIYVRILRSYAPCGAPTPILLAHRSHPTGFGLRPWCLRHI